MREAAIEEKTKLATALKEQLGLELSEAKTLVTPVTEPMRFLGHHIRVRRHPSRRKMGSTGRGGILPPCRELGQRTAAQSREVQCCMSEFRLALSELSDIRTKTGQPASTYPAAGSIALT
jgi:hypothetical protein